MTAFEAGAVVTAAGACVTDLIGARIPNSLTLLSVAAGLVAHSTLPGGGGAIFSAAGLGAGLVVFFPFFALGGLGGGDVKLMAAIGAWIGAPAVLMAALHTALAGGVLAVGVAAARGYLLEAFRNIGKLAKLWASTGLRVEPSLTLERASGPRLPYALPILAGLLLTIWRQ